jgi:hypothetical protein
VALACQRDGEGPQFWHNRDHVLLEKAIIHDFYGWLMRGVLCLVLVGFGGRIELIQQIKQMFGHLLLCHLVVILLQLLRQGLFNGFLIRKGERCGRQCRDFLHVAELILKVAVKRMLSKKVPLPEKILELIVFSRIGYVHCITYFLGRSAG